MSAIGKEQAFAIGSAGAKSADFCRPVTPSTTEVTLIVEGAVQSHLRQIAIGQSLLAEKANMLTATPEEIEHVTEYM